MDAPLVISIVAKDRPGLVESLAATVARHGGNWLESRMSRLGGQFAGILRVTVPESGRDVFLSDLKQLEAAGMRLIFQLDQPVVPHIGGYLAELTLVGQDRPGIVKQISQAFARSNANVEEFQTEVTSAPMSGESLFHARAKVQIPPNCQMQSLRAEFEKIASDLMVDLNLRELPQAN